MASPPPPVYFAVDSVDHIQEKLARFKYTTCALAQDYAAFGTSAGSVHIYQLSAPKPATVISFPTLTNPVTFLSLSSSGKWLILGDCNGIHFIEEPLTVALLFFSLNVKPVTAVFWTAEPPGRTNKQLSYALVGDEGGNVWTIRHQTSDLLVTLPAPIVQLSTIGDGALVATRNGAVIVGADKHQVPIGRKPPQGDYGAIFAQGFDAIVLSRPGGKLAFADQTGAIKATVPFLKGDEALDGLGTNLSQLRFCPPFIVSAGRDQATFVINLSTMSLGRVLTNMRELMDVANDPTRVLFLTRTRIWLFRVMRDPVAYIRHLCASAHFYEAGRVAIENQIRDVQVLGEIQGNEDPEFVEYAEKVAWRSKPRPLSEADPSLYERLVATDVPDKELMDAINAIRPYCIFDDEFRQHVDRYLLSNPADYAVWVSELHANYLVPLLNAKEETAEYAMKIAERGDSELCKLLHGIESLALDFCVANSPPLMPYNFTGDKRREFEQRLAGYDPFVEAGEQDLEEEPLIDSIYMKEREAVSLANIGAEKFMMLLRLYEWESNINRVIDELRTSVDVFLLSKQHGELPPWVEDSLQGEKSGMRSRDPQPDACGNWGLVVSLTSCPICGMQHNLGESVSSVAIFPCTHTFHMSCLHTRHCPVCYSGCMK